MAAAAPPAPALPGWLESWTSTSRDQVEKLRMQHRREREKLELELETTFIESSFSTQLVDLMQREEAAGMQGRFDVLDQVAQRVDNMLATETNRHFSNQSEMNQRRLAALFRHQVLERDRLTENINDQISRICRALRVPLVDERVLSTFDKDRGQEGTQKDLNDPEVFAAEERRIHREAQGRMGDNDRFHIEAAFGLQLKRVDAEWGTHEAQMQQDYEAQRAALEGKRFQANAVQEAQGPWKSKEKMSRLIHTAPVIQPDVGPVGRSRSNSRGRGKSNDGNKSTELELRALDNAFLQAKERMQHQKANATRWIKRQQQRMTIQLKYIDRDRQLAGQHMEREEADLVNLLRRIHCFCGWCGAQGPLPDDMPALHSGGSAGKGTNGSVGANSAARPKTSQVPQRKLSKGSYYSTQEVLPTLAASMR